MIDGKKMYYQRINDILRRTKDEDMKKLIQVMNDGFEKLEKAMDDRDAMIEEIGKQDESE
jgi:hypothetical protein